MKRTPLQIALRKRAEALASIEVRRRSIARLEARVAALDAEIAALGGRKLAPAKPRLPVRANGEMQREMFELLRKQGRATAADLAAVMLRRFKLPNDAATTYAMRQRCIQAFKRCERRGLVRCVGRSMGKRRSAGRFMVWSLGSG